MTLNGVMAVILCYFTEFGKPAFQHLTGSICGGIYSRVYFVLPVRCRRYESNSRSLSHLLISFLLTTVAFDERWFQNKAARRKSKTFIGITDGWLLSFQI